MTLVEQDPRISAVWKIILGPRSLEFAQKVRTFCASQSSVNEELTDKPADLFATAWQTLLRNRISHGGITAPGSGVLKEGEAGKGVSSRWYPETLANRITRIFAMRERITFLEGDAIQLLEKVDRSELWRDAAFFIDPPYPRAGLRLYDYGVLDHEKLFSVLSRLPYPFLATYERGAQPQKLAARHGFYTRTTGMRTRSHRHRRELLISNEPFYNRPPK